MSKSTDLTEKMIALADSGHDRAQELRECAQTFDEAAKGFFSEPQTVSVGKFMKAWAQARVVYCECTGEPLV